MTARVPVTVNAPAPNLNTAFDVATWLQGIGIRQVRLTCGLIMFCYVFSHFFNHALGNVSYDVMEWWLRYHMWWWRSLPGATILYSAAIVHLSLGLWALYQRRHFRYGIAEFTQLVLGLSIPLWLNIHFVGARLNGTLFDRTLYYAQAFYAYWINRPYVEWVQFGLLGVAARLHRALLLAPAETLVQSNGAVFAGCRGIVAHACTVRPRPGWARGDPARHAAAMGVT